MSSLDFDSYRVKLPYPPTPSAPEPLTQHESPEVHEQRVLEYNEAVRIARKKQLAYLDEHNRQVSRFKTDAIRAAGLEGHEAAERAFSFAMGHANGYSQVFYYLECIAEVILGDDA